MYASTGGSLDHRLSHQVLATNKAEDGDVVVLVEDAEGAQDFV